jgi:hypothetical protein
LLTAEQAFSCVRVCQMLSNLYQAIYLFRYDSKLKTVFILAKNQNDIDKELQIIIFANGIWRFIDDETRL